MAARRVLVSLGIGAPTAFVGGTYYSQQTRPLQRDVEAQLGEIDPAELDTGDLVIFDRNCDSFGLTGNLICRYTKFATGQPWDHVAMIVKVGDEPHVLEATFTGVKLRPYSERLLHSKSKQILIRKLDVQRSPDMRMAVDDFVQDVVGKPYERDWLQLARAIYSSEPEHRHKEVQHTLIHKQRELDQSIAAAARLRPHTDEARAVAARRLQLSEDVLLLERARQSVEHEARNHPLKSPEEDLSSIFCSELVAAAYQRMGLLSDFPSSSAYLPTHFVDHLPLNQHATLQEEVRVR